VMDGYLGWVRMKPSPFTHESSGVRVLLPVLWLSKSTSHTMPTKEDIERILNIIQDIEANGGSAGYKKNPELFQEFANEVYARPTEEEIIINGLEALKESKADDDYVGKIKLLEVYVATQGDHRVKGVLHKFQKLESDIFNLEAFESLITDLRTLSEENKGTLDSVNNLVLQTIESIEALGGSAGFQKYASKFDFDNQSTGNNTRTPDDSWVKGDGFILTHPRYPSITDVGVGVTARNVSAIGVIWDIELRDALVWGTLYHEPVPKGVEVKSTIELESIGGNITAWFARNNALMAMFHGEGEDLGPVLPVKGEVGWRNIS